MAKAAKPKKKGSIPRITRRDLEQLRIRHALSVAGACDILGIQRVLWTELVKTDEPITDAALAALVRLYQQHPEIVPVARKPDMVKLFDTFCTFFEHKFPVGARKDNAVMLRAFSTMFGREHAAGYRWIRGKNPSPIVARLAQAIMKTSVPMKALSEVAEAEAKSRGLSVWDAQGWSD
jgi:hypothetical protein